MNSIVEFCEATKDFFVTTGKIVWYLVHPKDLLLLLWDLLVQYSLPVCLMTCLIALILYLCGWKKVKPFISGSFFGYLAIQMINSAL